MTTASEAFPTILEIQRAVADFFGVALNELKSDRRDRSPAHARQIAMFLARELTLHSLPMIGRSFRRDHSTILYAIRQVEARRRAGSETDRALRSLRRRIDAVVAAREPVTEIEPARRSSSVDSLGHQPWWERP